MYRKHPKFLNLMEIKLPLPGVISILHRVSGVILFFPGIPILLYSLQMILESPQSHDKFHIILTSLPVKSGLLLFVWFFMHHLCAGIRYLALDLNYGIELKQARINSWLVFVAGIVLTLLFEIAIW